MLARDLQNVLLTGKTQNALKSEETIQHTLPSHNGKHVPVCRDWWEGAYCAPSIRLIRELKGAIAKPHFQTGTPHLQTLDEVACSELSREFGSVCAIWPQWQL